jgi:hypothetical protein
MTCPVKSGKKKIKHTTTSATNIPIIDCDTAGFNPLSSNSFAQYTIANIKNG